MFALAYMGRKDGAQPLPTLLFRRQNRFISGNGVELVPKKAFSRFGARMAEKGYLVD
jgi:hypothetical protein